MTFTDKNKANSRSKLFKILSYVNRVHVYSKWYRSFYYKRYIFYFKKIMVCISHRCWSHGYFVEGEYNATTHACCKGHLNVIIGASWHCCGKEIIDYSLENCCSGKRFNIKNQQCCKGDYFGFQNSIIVIIYQFEKTADSLSSLQNKHRGFI